VVTVSASVTDRRHKLDRQHHQDTDTALFNSSLREPVEAKVSSTRSASAPRDVHTPLLSPGSQGAAVGWQLSSPGKVDAGAAGQKRSVLVDAPILGESKADDMDISGGEAESKSGGVRERPPSVSSVRESIARAPDLLAAPGGLSIKLQMLGINF
jgi:hypothetical protein